MLQWIKTHDQMTSLSNDNELTKRFNFELNNQMRKSKLTGIRKSILLNVLVNLSTPCDFENSEYYELLRHLLRKKPTRNLSGVTIITVITAPFPDGQKFSCKHNCYYCPNEPAHEENNWQAQPRSYLYNEPAVRRANQHDFKALNQMINRMDTYYSNGLIVDKLEIIVEGGTFTEYPVEYLERYHRDIFYAANIYFDLRRLYPKYDKTQEDLDISLLTELREPLSIEEEITINKTAHAHIIGICIETRPDAIDSQWLHRFRKWGITRVQLGMQHVDNSILKKINRGHTIEEALWAIQYLKDNCFKLDIHIMPDLPGSTPEIDIKMFDYVYSVVCPDQMKVYPHQIVPWTITKKWYDEGKYVPYNETNPKALKEVVRYSMEKCPNYIRLPRVMRDIPSSYVCNGGTDANLREQLDNELLSEGVSSNDIRSREIGRHSSYYDLPAQYNVYYNRANNGDDYFITYESFDKKVILGFIRLRIVDKCNLQEFKVLKNKGLIRELHVYSNTTRVGTKKKRGCQHNGIGTNLLKISERITKKNGLSAIAVISGEGVKEYYEKRGYHEIDTFMVKEFFFLEMLFFYLIERIRILLFH
tara:strand:+ start:684 stop:2450 length:1767 start_codon:yes stop_codon:yes gene_type:complete